MVSTGSQVFTSVAAGCRAAAAGQYSGLAMPASVHGPNGPVTANGPVISRTSGTTARTAADVPSTQRS